MTAGFDRAHWDKLAENADYEVCAEPDPGRYREVTRLCQDEILAGLGDLHGRVLDLGCGVGRVAFPLAGRFPDARIVGIDISPKMVRTASSRVSTDHPNVEFYVCNGQDLPAPVGRLAAAWSVLVFQHIPGRAIRSYMRQIGARLWPGGRFRFQWVEGDNPEISRAKIIGWCADAGLIPGGTERSAVYENWRWMTARRP